jgi:transcriptional regulator with XRE-family HTH domain
MATTTLRTRLRTAREIAGVSARELDRLAGLGEAHTSMIEAGDRVSIETNTAVKLCTALGASLDWLLRGQGKPPTSKEVRIAIANSRRGLRSTGTDG